MSTRNRVPPLLEPYLRLPPETSLLLLTGVLNATPHWLVTRALRSAFGETSSRQARQAAQELDGGSVPSGGETGGNGEGEVAVVLVSWMRDWEFWKIEARRGAGLDLGRMAQDDKIAFVDGLSGLFDGDAKNGGASGKTTLPARTIPPPATSPTPTRLGALPVRGAPPTPRNPASPPEPQSQTQQPQKPKNIHTLTSATPSAVLATIQTAINTLSPTNTKKVLLILDSPTLLLSLTPLSAPNLNTLLLSLRSLVHSTILSVEADSPFLSAARSALETSFSGTAATSGRETEIEKAHAAFVALQAHVARWIVGVRGLDTGVARDVSGVLRVGRGGGWDELGDDEEKGKDAGREMEVLYFVQADGGVRVFERGAGFVG